MATGAIITTMKLAQSTVSLHWGKARPQLDSGPKWHPLVWHLPDVAASAERILAACPCARRIFAKALGLNESDAVRLAVLLAAFHDLGKFAAPFQRKAEGPAWPFVRPRDAQFGISEHDRDGLMVWNHHLSARYASAIWPHAEGALRS